MIPSNDLVIVNNARHAVNLPLLTLAEAEVAIEAHRVDADFNAIEFLKTYEVPVDTSQFEA